MGLTREHFEPKLSLEGRRIAVDPQTRRIAVRVAGFDEIHSGYSGDVRPPRHVNVEAAHVGYAELDDGSVIPVATLPMGTLHASGDLSAEEARQVYENTGRQVARVRYSLDEVGIRADGVLYDDVDDVTIQRLVASAPSGDWRTLTHIRHFEEFQDTPSEMVGTAIVNFPGFSDSFAKESARPMRLVASAASMLLIEEGDVGAKQDPCEGEGPCEACTCGRADVESAESAVDAEPGGDEDDAGDDVELAEGEGAALTAAADGANRLDLLERRVMELEEIVARAISSM